MTKKIFISHSHKDSEYGKVLVQLLRDIGVSQEQIIFTSDPNYGVHLGVDIFDYLRLQINDKAYIVYLLSDNYYDSVACMNEMGAAWVIHSEQNILLLPGFDTHNPKFQSGVIDGNRVWARVDDQTRMEQFVDSIITYFGLSTNFGTRRISLERYLSSLNTIINISSVSNAIKLMEINNAIQGNQNLAKNYCLKAFYQYELDKNNYTSAIQSCLYSIFIDPNYIDAYSRLCQILGSAGNLDRSVSIAQEMCRRFPENALSYGCLSYAQFSQKEYDSSIRNATHAIELDPDNSWFLLLRGLAYEQLGESNLALSDLFTCYEKDQTCKAAISAIKRLYKDSEEQDIIKLYMNWIKKNSP